MRFVKGANVTGRDSVLRNAQKTIYVFENILVDFFNIIN
jgi:hypothetical protein